MTDTELQYILKIAECKNLTQAAELLYVSQPSLSQTIAKLEKQYGAAIFLRTSTNMELTEYGQLFVRTASAMLRRYRQFEHELDDFHHLKKGELRFGLPEYLGALILPIILPAFACRFPNVTIRYYENTSENLNKMLHDGVIDFAILHSHEQSERTKCEILFDDPFLLITPAREQTNTGILPILNNLDSFEQENFILISKGHKSRDVEDSILEKAKITPKICYTTKSMETAKRLVATGLGVTFLPASYLHLFSGVDNICAYRLAPELMASWSLILSYPQNMHLSESAWEFIRLLREYAQNFSCM